MIQVKNFKYSPGDHEAEKASNSYLMSLIAVIAGLPLPIVNLGATFIFYMGNRRGTYFVRWHCTQALLSQMSLLVCNSFAFWWTIGIVFSNAEVTNTYVGYMVTVLFFNLFEFIATIYTAVRTRKGVHVEWWLYGGITQLICKEKL